MLYACLCISPINFQMAELISIQLCMCIMAPELISTAYFMNPSHQSVCLYVYPSIVARQWLGRNVTTVANTDVPIEELLDASFSMWSVSYQGEQAISSSQNFL
jgi:hypothetical protein